MYSAIFQYSKRLTLQCVCCPLLKQNKRCKTSLSAHSSSSLVSTNRYLHDTLLLDLPSESEGENLVNFIQCHCPLNIKAKLPAAGNFSLKQRVSTSTLVNFTLKV